MWRSRARGADDKHIERRAVRDVAHGARNRLRRRGDTGKTHVGGTGDERALREAVVRKDNGRGRARVDAYEERHSSSSFPSSGARSHGAIAPSGTARAAPVTRGTFAARPRSVSYPSTAKAIASFASTGTPIAVLGSTRAAGSRAHSRASSVRLCAPPPETSTRAAARPV